MALSTLKSSPLPFSLPKSSPLPFDPFHDAPSTVTFVGSRRNRPKITPLRANALPFKFSHVPSCSFPRTSMNPFLVGPISPPRTRTEASKRSGWAKTSKNSRARAKKMVLYALIVVAVGSVVVLVALRYAPLPEGVMSYVRGAKDWISSKMVLDETTRYVIWDRTETAMDLFKTFSGTVVLAWIQLIPLIWLHYQHQKSGLGDPAKKRQPVIQKVSFEDVEGVGAAKEELREIVSCLQGSTSYDKLGAEPPRGTLLVGPPGTGKTLLARAVAGEAGVPFFSASASEFVEVFVGRGAARVRELFKEARKHEPSIVFIDELDSVGGKRGRSFNDEHDQTLVQLLTEMDGFETGSKVIVLAATNRPETLDSALCRPGRFSRKVLVGKPDLEGRKKILSVHLRGVPLEDDSQETCDVVAAMTPGFVGADLANIVKESVLLAARRGAEAVSREDITKAVERGKFGIENHQKGEADSEDNVQRNGPYAVSGLYC